MKKKVLIIPSWYVSHRQDMAGSFFREQAILVKDDFDLKLVYFKYKPCTAFFFFFVKTLYKLRLAYLLKNIFYQKEEIDDEINTHFFTIYTCPNINKDRNNWFLKWQVQQVIDTFFLAENWKPDLIHAHCTFYAGIFANIVATKYHIPYIITEHHGPFFAHEYGKHTFFEAKKTIENANVICAVSRHQARIILMHNFLCKPIIIGNYVNETHYQKKINTQKTTKPINILTVGNRLPLKDSETFVLAIKTLLENGYDVQATVIGGLQENENLQNCGYYQKATALGIAHKFNILGKVNKGNMPKHYAEADIFVSTSVAESFGVSVCEALLMEIPTIAVSNGGIDDIKLENSNNCFLVPIQNPLKIAQIVQEILNGTKHFAPKPQRDYIIEQFGTKAFKKIITNLYLQEA